MLADGDATVSNIAENPEPLALFFDTRRDPQVDVRSPNRCAALRCGDSRFEPENFSFSKPLTSVRFELR